MDDASIQNRIEQLVAEEHELQDTHGDADRQTRLEQVKVELDQCWDLLRRRRAREEFGQDPDTEQPRDADTVEGYRQ